VPVDHLHDLAVLGLGESSTADLTGRGHPEDAKLTQATGHARRDVLIAVDRGGVDVVARECAKLSDGGIGHGLVRRRERGVRVQGLREIFALEKRLRESGLLRSREEQLLGLGDLLGPFLVVDRRAIRACRSREGHGATSGAEGRGAASGRPGIVGASTSDRKRRGGSLNV